MLWKSKCSSNVSYVIIQRNATQIVIVNISSLFDFDFKLTNASFLIITISNLIVILKVIYIKTDFDLKPYFSHSI
jgi:hypothetical protein